MKKNFLKKAVRGLLCSLAMTTVLAGGGMEAFAYTTDDHPLAQTSVDGQVFTIAEELPYYDNYDASSGIDYSFWYDNGTPVSTGISYNLPVVGVGQHMYSYDREGLVPSHSESASLLPHGGLAPNKPKIENGWKCTSALQPFLF